MFTLLSRYAPPPPPGVAPPPASGDPAVVSERLGAAVRDIRFNRDIMIVPSLSPQHNREMTERTAGPVMKLVEALRTFDPGKLATFRQDYEALAAEVLRRQHDAPGLSDDPRDEDLTDRRLNGAPPDGSIRRISCFRLKGASR